MASGEPMEEYLRNCLAATAMGSDQLHARVQFPSDLQGPPETGHGGGVAAMLVELVRLLAGERGGEVVLPRPLRVDVTLHRALPLETALEVEAAATPAGWVSRILRDGSPIAEAEISPGAASLPAPAPEAPRGWEASRHDAFEVPAYEFCLGCGQRNPRGAQIRFAYNDEFMWKRLAPQGHFRCRDGSLFPGYFAIVCDELGWWLGALRQGECGLSNRVSLLLGPPVPHEAPLLALGVRSAVRTDDPKERVWQTQAMVVTPDGHPVASAGVQFVGSRAFTKVMLPRFLWAEDLAAVRRVFPRYAAELADREFTGGGAP